MSVLIAPYKSMIQQMILNKLFNRSGELHQQQINEMMEAHHQRNPRANYGFRHAGENYGTFPAYKLLPLEEPFIPALLEILKDQEELQERQRRVEHFIRTAMNLCVSSGDIAEALPEQTRSIWEGIVSVTEPTLTQGEIRNFQLKWKEEMELVNQQVVYNMLLR